MSYIIKNTSPFVSIKLTETGREQLALFYFCVYLLLKKRMGEKIDNEIFKKRATLIHDGKYDYSLLEYKNNKTKVKIICPIHGEFEQESGSHLKGNGCLKCSGKNLTTEEFINKVKEKHGNKYNYSLVDYKGSFKKIKIICPIHGEFEQFSDKHIKGHGCLLCKESKGEREIRVFLEENNIKFEQQFIFNDCRDKNPLPFDFYLPNLNICIEYDGRQHYEVIDRWGGLEGFLDQQKKDKIKNNYCETNKIHLLRISYKENIKNKLNENICHIL
jgi:hypothetical protein